MAKILSPELAASYFLSQGVKLGQWNGLEALPPKPGYAASDFCTGKPVYELINFSQHVVGWLRKGDWKILQIDNSSYFFPDQALVLASLLIGPKKQVDLVNSRTFLFEFGVGETEDFQTEVVLAYLINLMLVYEAHCYVLSSGGAAGEMLAVQDGVVYFYGDDARLALAKTLLDEFAAMPNKVAPWVAAMNDRLYLDKGTSNG